MGDPGRGAAQRRGLRGRVRLVVNGQPCGLYLGVSEARRGLLFVGTDCSAVLSDVSVEFSRGAMLVQGRLLASPPTTGTGRPPSLPRNTE
jgi:hypothetical protein